MTCPHCAQPLAILELEGIEIDHCLACGGTWLDAGELETIALRAGAPRGRLAALVAGAGAGETGRKRCVRCRVKMKVITVGEHAPVQLDRCPRGHGLWFDAGEIRRLVEGAAEGHGEEAQAVARFFADALAGRL